MIKIDRNELLELASAYVIANTPESLARGLLKTSGVTRMRQEEVRSELRREYELVTTRANRTEISMGLAYGLLLGIVLNVRNEDPDVSVDTSRLHWGDEVAEVARRLVPSSQSIVIHVPRSDAKVTTSNQIATPIIFVNQ